VAVFETPNEVAAIVAFTLPVTFLVETVNLAVKLPAGIVTVAGTVADVKLLVSFTAIPPVGATALRVRVPEEDAPPFTLAGVRLKETRTGGLTVIVAVCETAPRVAVTLTAFAIDTATVVALKVALAAPARTVTVVGTLTVVAPLTSLTTNPPFGAIPFNVAVPTEVAPPVNEFGLKLRDATEIGDIVSVADLVTLPSLAVIVAEVWVVTALVETENDALICPAEIVTELGTMAEPLLLAMLTTAP